MFGLKRGTVTLLPHNPRWIESFIQEKRDILAVCGSSVIEVEHIGSTAIPDIKAKPIMDLMVGVNNIDYWKKLQPHLETLGYQFRKDLKDEQDHILFVKGSEENRTHYLKITEFESPFWDKSYFLETSYYLTPHTQKNTRSLKSVF